MKTTKLLTLLVALVVASATITSCQDDDNWQPTWALPLVKQFNLNVGDFVDPASIESFNARIRTFWQDYVSEELDIPSGGGGSTVVDSVAYAIITQPSDNNSGNGGNNGNNDQYALYVDYTAANGAPQLNQATIAKLIARGKSQAEIDEINVFLIDYWNSHPELHPQVAGVTSLKKANRIALPKNGGSGTTNGGSAVDNLLNGIVGNSQDVFTTAANLIDHVGGHYIDSINNEVDSILVKASMNDLIDFDLREIIKEGSQVFRISLTMDMSNTMPFSVNFAANLVDADGDSIINVFKGTLGANAPKQTLNPFNLDAGSSLDKVFDQAKAVKLQVDCKRTNSLTQDQLRILAAKGITFSMRVRVKAQMSDITKELF